MNQASQSSLKQTAQLELFEGWQRWLSFTCIWVWSCVTALLAITNDVLLALPGVLASPNEVVLIASAVGLLVVFVCSNRIASVVDSRTLIALGGSSLVLGSVLFVLGVTFGGGEFFVVGMCFGGITIALLKIAWGEMYSRMGLSRGLVSMGYALTAAMIFVLIVQSLPQIWLSILLVCVALPCAPLVYLGTKKLSIAGTEVSPPTKPIEFSSSLLLLPALVALSYGMVKGMMPWLGVVESAATGNAVRIAELIVGIALIVFAQKLGKRFGAAQIYACALIFVVSGLVLVSYQGAPQWLSFGIHEMGFSLFYFFMVVYWGDLARRANMPIVKVYTIGYGVFQLAQIAGSLVGYYLVGNQSQNYALLILLSVVLAFFVVALLLFSNTHSSLRQWLIADEARNEQGDEIPIACSIISKNGGLSPREMEVLSLLARGRNASYIARALCISLDTAKTHIKNIYRKLDIHTQQDLLDMIDQTIET